jgi:CubicO group peptidase (beta-lactamase class C family)
MTKSLTNAIIGNMSLKGKIKIDQKAPIFEWRQDNRKNIKIDDLMRMSSGLSWKENYSGPSDATNMLFIVKHVSLFAAESKLRYEPGSKFYYSSGTTNIISRLIRQTYNDDYYYRFPYEEIFHKIGMYSLVMELDAGGTFVGSSYAYATARDWARFGLLYLHDGVWNGERLLPAGWVDYSTTRTKGAPRGEYGAQFWLNAGPEGDPSKRLYPDAPTDLYWADGFEGQNVFIIPSKELVIVKLSQTTGNALDDNEFLKNIIALLP